MAEIDIDIFSMNCNGLNDNLKRTAVFSKLKRISKGIILLQETHSTPENECRWQNDWGNKNIYFSHGLSNSRGVAIVITDNYDAKVTDIKRDINGRIIVINIERNGTVYTVGNIYAPTRNFEREQQSVFKELTNYLEEIQTEHVICGGDFNLYMDPRLDKIDSLREPHDNRNYREDITSYLEVNNLVDIWRTIHPNEKFFTWHRGDKRTRLDYIFCSDHLLNFTEYCNILPGIQSDHSLLKLSLKSGNTQNKGKGFWKFNASLLYDTVYVENIKRIINNVAHIHNDTVDKGAVWEFIKLEIRSYTIPYCIEKAKQRNVRERELNKKYEKLYGVVNSDATLDETTIQNFYDTKSQLENLERERSKGIILRAKSQWVEDGEKNTSYFLRLEKQNYCNKLITKIKIRDKVITNPVEILEEERNFYMKLYSNDITAVETDEIIENCEHKFTGNMSLPKLNDMQKTQCEGLITENELLKSIKSFKNNKTPGTDGLTAEFYKFFWQDIKHILLSSINFALTQGRLSVEQKRGIISLLPKKDKERLYLKNWRPITLLNVDYKILAKALGNRIISHLPSLIDEDQTGYVKKRFIGNNIRIIEDIIVYTKTNNVAGILLAIDFEKAFDSLRWSFLDKCLEAFNFGQQFRSYINVLYCDISAAVINNGYISRWFSPKKGVRQGCPLSPYLFILAVETLSCAIRNSELIRGIRMNDSEIKITQLADDTTCFVKDKLSLRHLLALFKQFELCAGLKMNVEKTKAKVLGPEAMPRDNLYGLDWTEDAIHTLGVTISTDENNHYLLNYKKRLKNMKNLLSGWKCRKLSLKGKVTVINTLAISPLIYLASVIHVPDQVIHEVKQIIVDFVWDSKPPKVAYNVMIQSIENGGLKLVDFECKVKSLKISFIKRLLNNKSGKCRDTAANFLKTSDLNYYFKCNRIPDLRIGNKFYEETLKYWGELQQIQTPTVEVIHNQVIWENRYITISNKPFLWRNWLQKGIVHVHDIIKGNGEFLDHNEIKEKYDINCNFLNALQIRHSLPMAWRHLITNRSVTIRINGPFVYVNGKAVPLQSTESKVIYKKFIQYKYRVPTCCIKWNATIIGPTTDDEWSKIFQWPYQISRETRLQSLQYKIIHRTINCNKKLFDMKLKDSPRCSYCDEIDDIPHFFIKCEKVKLLWCKFFDWWNGLGYPYVHFTGNLGERDFLFGLSNGADYTTALNFCMLHIKNYIYRQRLFNDNDMELEAIKNILLVKFKIEKDFLSRNNKQQNFAKYELLYNDLVAREISENRD